MKKSVFATFLIVVVIAASCAKQEVVTPEKVEPTVTKKQEPPPVKEAPNPFFTEWETPYGTPPFDKIEQKHYFPAIERALAENAAEIKAIAENPEPPTFENTLVAMDRSGELMSKVAPVFFGMVSANTNDELQAIARKARPMMSKHRDDIMLNQKLFDRIKAVHDQMASLKLNREQERLVEEYYKDFVRSGAGVDEEGKKKLREINEQLTMLSFNFSENLLKENQKYALVIEKKEDLEGLPDGVIAAAAQAAEQRGHKGKWVFTLDRPSVYPFLTYSTKREMREQILTAYADRGGNGDDLDNQEILTKIAALRIDKAKLLGFDTWAEFMLDRRMAKEPKNVYELTRKVWKAALPVAKKEARQLQKMARKDGQKFKLEAWDWRYYAEKLRQEKYNLADEELRPYFELNNVRDGAFAVANKLYGITFEPRTDIPVYHPDVQTFEVKEADGKHIGIFYMDFHPRPGKRGGAWASGYRSQRIIDGKFITPLITNTCNFTPPTEGKPSLLSFEEVETLFHEFGHALHALFSNVTYERVGDAVSTDFVELPSQIMENWAAEPEVLKMYAKHHKTGEPIPDELVEKIKKSSHFNQGFATVEYLSASFLDMDWHMLKKPTTMKAKEFEAKSLKKIGLIPEIIVRYRSTNFQHIFASSYYAAGYYSYMWSEVLDADAYEAFKEKGLFDQETAKKFRVLLSKGGAEEGMELYKEFRGREPKTKPLLKRKGMAK